MDAASNSPELSVVVPLFNEEENVGLLYERIVEVCEKLDGGFEAVFVDDFSTDRTFEVAQEIALTDKRLKLVRFRRNHGQTPAMAAGIAYSRGRVIVTMDGDLQNDPKDIPALLEKIAGGADMAVGWRHNRQDHFVTRKLPSIIANKLIAAITGVPIRDNGCSLKAFRAELIKQLPLYSEMHRFIPAISSIAGARIEQVRVRHHARMFGTSKYGLSRVYKVLFDLIAIKTLTQFSSRPLHWFGSLSIPFWLATVAFLVVPLSPSFSDSSLVIIFALATISASTAGFFLTCGVLCELLIREGKYRPASFWRLTERVERYEG